MSEFVFETKDLCYAYTKNKKNSLKDVNIRIVSGKKTVLLGANGAGKSTLFYHFNGIFKPKSGEILYNGHVLDYSKEALRQLRSDVAVVVQNPDEQIFSSTVEEDIAFGLLNMGMSHDDVDKRIDEVLFIVGMSEYRMTPTQQLSYGQKKRIAFAGAIATRPKVLILDEPTAGLDPQMAQETMEIADQLHHTGTTVLISTHDVDLAYAWADEMHVIRNGELIYSGNSETFYRDPVCVSMSGLMPPSMFAINRNLSLVDGMSEEPTPHTRAELLAKMSKDAILGKVHLATMCPEITKDVLEEMRSKIGNNVVVGIFGIETRRMAYRNELRLDYVFNGIENCILETMHGNDAILLYDASIGDMVIADMERLKEFGLEISMEVIS